MRDYKYILKGKRAVRAKSLLQWGRWFQTANRRVADTRIGRVRVSTVFLGLDHNFMGRGAPVLFETMVFGGTLDRECYRYSTWKEAEKGHQAFVNLIKTTKLLSPSANKEIV